MEVWKVSCFLVFGLCVGFPGHVEGQDSYKLYMTKVYNKNACNKVTRELLLTWDWHPLGQNANVATYSIELL